MHLGWVEGCRTEKRKWTKMGVYVRYKRKMAMHILAQLVLRGAGVLESTASAGSPESRPEAR